MQEMVKTDPTLRGRSPFDLLDQRSMPAYVSGLLDGCSAVCGYVYANGNFRLWTDENFAGRFFTPQEANRRFAQLAVLPSFIFGRCVVTSFSHPVPYLTLNVARVHFLTAMGLWTLCLTAS